MKEIKINFHIIKFILCILKQQVLFEKDVPNDIFFQAQGYISSHSDTLKYTKIYKSYITHQTSLKQNQPTIRSVQLSTTEEEKCLLLYKILIKSTRFFRIELLHKFLKNDEYQRRKWINSKHKIPHNEWKIKNNILSNLDKYLPGFKLLVEYDVNNLIASKLSGDKFDLYYGGMVFVSEVGVIIMLDLKYPEYKLGSFLEEKRVVTQKESYTRYECWNDQVLSRKRIEKLKKMVEKKFEEESFMVIGAKFIYESSRLEFYDGFDKLIAGKVNELTKANNFDQFTNENDADVGSTNRNLEDNGTCETIVNCFIVVIFFSIYMLILKLDLETQREWEFFDIQDDDNFIEDLIGEIIVFLFQSIFSDDHA
ncbi:2039_t:CDS:2 [Funneliformis geosporum]|uniref:5989_t:CDS:1 n=1 Tax=Funneliformis geosporum TaxID=1117311 RepID=A0A9W4SN08_9GLOM|nr:2039_t:CDS:2 [Funneliformis geosporum]CAI2172937.1 5989_t:CDS:2 [Funneliformis geosporum]